VVKVISIWVFEVFHAHINSIMHFFTHSYTQLLFTLSLSLAHTLSLTLSLTHSLTRLLALTHSLIRSFTHSHSLTFTHLISQFYRKFHVFKNVYLLIDGQDRCEGASPAGRAREGQGEIRGLFCAVPCSYFCLLLQASVLFVHPCITVLRVFRVY
jgi:hypothetical protein